MRWKVVYTLFILVGFMTGILLAIQFRMTREFKDKPLLERPLTLAEQVAGAREERDDLQKKVDLLRTQIDQSVASPELAKMKEELDRYRMLAGIADVAGPGVEVTLDDSTAIVQPGENPNLYVLHDEDVLLILNELRAAGAEALAINGQRVISTTEVRCIGPTILINKRQRLTPPFVITAIGAPDTLYSALKMKSGVVESLQFWGIQVKVKKVPSLVIKGYSGTLDFDYAVPVDEGKSVVRSTRVSSDWPVRSGTRQGGSVFA